MFKHRILLTPPSLCCWLIMLSPSICLATNGDDSADFFAEWIDQYQQQLADTVHNIGAYLDQSLTNNNVEQALINRSYLRLRNRSFYSYRGQFDNEFKLYFKLDLPYVKRNWKLIIDSEHNDFDSLESKQRNLSSSNGHTSSDAVGAFRLEETTFTHWHTDFDVGVKLKLPLDPFTRLRLSRVDNLTEKWTTHFEQQLFYYHSMGLGALSKFCLYYALSPHQHIFLKSSSSAQYLKEGDNWELVQQVELFHRPSDKILYEYSAGISADTGEDKEITNYWVSATWTKRIYKHWLYLSLRPQLAFPREYNHQANVGIMVSLEMFFSKNRQIDRLGRYIPDSTLPHP